MIPSPDRKGSRESDETSEHSHELLVDGDSFAVHEGMHCPECNSAVDQGAGACHSCGLLLISATPSTVSHRRAEDLATTGRRAADKDQEPCRFCGGTLLRRAIRCRYCSEIVNDDYYRERAQRLRARVNYASWIAYLFGLGALLVFRPVGLVAIAAGLLMSIVYYAIPVEPPTGKGLKKPGFLKTLKRQLRLERVNIPIPRMNNKKLVFVGTPLIAALVGYSANLFLLQEPMNDVLKENAFQGMSVSAHYQYWVVPGVVVYDLEQVGVRTTPFDVHTAFLEFAKKLKEKRYSRVELSYQGHTKFSMTGSSFASVGKEYAKRNYQFALYRLPRLLQAEDGARTPARNAPDHDAMLQFHKAWYGDDVMTQSVAKP